MLLNSLFCKFSPDQIQWKTPLLLLYSNTHVPDMLVLFSQIDNYAMNYNKDNFHWVGENRWISICVRVYNGIRYVVQLNLPVRPEGLQVTEGSADSLYHEKGHTIKPSSRPCGRFWTPATERHGPWSRACTGPTVNIVRWYPRRFPITASTYSDVDVYVLGRYYIYLDIWIGRVINVNIKTSNKRFYSCFIT